MRSGHVFIAALSLSHSQCASASFYLKDKWVGNDFFRDWNWETTNDPTHGRVNYVSQAEAIGKNLSYGTSSLRFSLILLDIQIHLTGTSSAENNALVMRADDWSIVDPSARGRDSVRISTQNAYGESIFVLDLAHMPAGCATWPAFWAKSQKGPWPQRRGSWHHWRHAPRHFRLPSESPTHAFSTCSPPLQVSICTR